MSSQEPSMGDIFRQRRAAAAASSSPSRGASSPSSKGGTSNSSSPPSKPSSLLQIQREQQQQQQQQQRQAQQHGQPMRNQGRSTGTPSRGGGGGGGGGARNNDRMSRRGSANSNNRGGGGGGGRNDNNNNNSSRSNLPLEQGVVHTLLDKFGFILCADRPVELFFHYSEYRDGHTDDLNIGDELQFRVGPSRGSGGGGNGEEEGEKVAALEVRRIPKGTIYWEKEEEPVGKRWRGLVEQPLREDGASGGRRGGKDGSRQRSNNSGSSEGVIRIVSDKKGQDDGGDGDNGGSGDGADVFEGVDIFYTPKDYTPVKPPLGGSNTNRLARSDIVEFTLVTERRTGKKFARDITLIQSERDRLKEEREAKLLESATLEQGKVVSNKGDFGFLRSTSRVEEVYFHISNVIAEEGAESKSRVLEEGQEVEFYVVSEGTAAGGGGNANNRRSSGGNKKGPKLSARKIKMLPQGTVKFEHILAEGITGIVKECPEPSIEPFGRGNEKKSEVINYGKIRLQEPIIDNESGVEVTEVLLNPDHYPGGTFALARDGSQLGVWIRPGDVVMFDVIRQISDGTCHAIPTKYTLKASLRPEGATPDDSIKPSIRLVEPSLLGRAEGVIRSIRDNFGFIHCAERNVDAYFPLFEVFPSDIHGDLVRNNPDVYEKDPIQKGGRIHAEVGMEVSFDLSLQMLTNAGGGRGRQKQSRSQEKESLRARRLQILPKSTVVEKIRLATGVRATVTKDDPKQPFVGNIDLEKSFKTQTSEQRHPMTARLLTSISEGKYGEEVVFHDVMSEKDVQVIISMVNANDDLEWKYVATPGGDVDDSHNRKLCILRKNASATADETFDDVAEASEAVTESSGDEAAEHQDANETTDNAGGIPAEENASEVAIEKSDDNEKPKSHQKKKNKKEKVVKTLRFDKFSFPDMSVGPPAVGDLITCDIVLSRRSGSLVVENIEIVERKNPVPVPVTDGEDNADAIETKEVNGFVTEVVPSRQFGFITAVDENGSKTGEHVFFSFKSVHVDGAAQDASVPASRNKKNSKGDLIRKGDEVKCDAAPGKNGKITATNIRILPRGTLKLPTKANPSCCTGYILLEPSHTSLENTPSHIVLHNGSLSSGGGRWDNCGKEDKAAHKSGSNVKEEGVILLLTDPAHLFSEKTISKSTESEATTRSSDSDQEVTNNNSGQESSDSNHGGKSMIGTHLKYKNGAMAFHGHAAGVTANRPEGPRRGDLVTFVKGKGGKLVKDLRIEKLGAATSVRGSLVDLKLSEGTAVFVSSENDSKYDINLSEVVSCEKSLLQENEQVDGIVHEGNVFGVCRTKDLFLASSFGRNSSGSSGGLKERPKLNLTVKKEMGGQIMAQSRMAKGPDGTNGFPPGWTKRLTAFAKEFVPTFDVAPSVEALEEDTEKAAE